jgi:hypothetical protein
MPIRIVIALLIFSLLSSAAVQASLKLPETVKVDPAALTAEPMCDPKISPAWREAQEIDGVKIAASPGCSPDNPAWIAAAVKGTNHVSMDTLMKTGFRRMPSSKPMIWTATVIPTGLSSNWKSWS